MIKKLLMFQIEAENAHPSSLLALEALRFLHENEQFRHILDVGCGNGILAITAAHLWPANVVAVDISKNAIADTQAALAEISPPLAISAFVSDGFKHPAIKKSAPYDLILCNLLAQWQISMAIDILKHLKKGGTVVLSGILQWQKEGVLAAFRSINFVEVQCFSQREWVCYILCHTSQN